MRIPRHIVPTSLLCLVPYFGMLLFLVISHDQTEIVHHPSTSWLFVLVLVGGIAPAGRLAALSWLLIREKDRFRLSLLVQVYFSLILIFASLFALLQVGQIDPSFSGMVSFWDVEQPGTLPHHVDLLNRVFGESLYLSVMTITTVGFGDIVPISLLARMLVMVEALAGIGFLGLAVGQYFSYCTHERFKQVKDLSGDHVNS